MPANPAQSSRIRFRLWNAAGWLAWWVGVSVTRGPIQRFGLWLCGLAGDFDGRADGYR